MLLLQEYVNDPCGTLSIPYWKSKELAVPQNMKIIHDRDKSVTKQRHTCVDHEEKERINRQKHGISFETASYVFRDEHYIEMYDFEHSMEEDRYIAIGMVGDLLFVVFTERGENIRLISARLATESERRLYYDQNFYN